MILINPWLFLLLVLSSALGYVLAGIYLINWWLHKRPKQPSPLPAPPSKIIRP